MSSAKLSESLPYALQYAKEIGDDEFEKWVRMELYGYDTHGGMTEADTVPEYRAVVGRWYDYHGRFLDLSDYPDLAMANTDRLRFGVAQLEELAERNELLNITRDDFVRILRDHVGFDAARFCFNSLSIRGVLDVIRNKLVERVWAHLNPN